MRYLLLLVFLSCSPEPDFKHSVESLIGGKWEISKIEIQTNSGANLIVDCASSYRYPSAFYMNLSFVDSQVALVEFPCVPSQFYAEWVLVGNEIGLVSGGVLYGKILYSEPNVLVIQFDTDYRPTYYFFR